MSENKPVTRDSCPVTRDSWLVTRKAMCFTSHERRATGFTSHGFTLIESLVAVFILAVIALAVYSSLSAGARIWARVNLGGEERRELLAWEKMRKNVRNTFSFKAIGFVGKGNEVSFPGIIPVKGDDGKIHQEVGRIRYYYDDECRCLCMSKISYIDMLKEVEAECQKEIEGIQGATFEYYGSVSGAGPGRYAWKQDWKQEKKPVAMRINIQAVHNDEKQFITLLP